MKAPLGRGARLASPGLAALLVVTVAACGSSPRTKHARTPTPPVAVVTPGPSATATAAPATPTPVPPTPTPNPCAVGPQAPPGGSIAADFATALAFAPDGRLFFAERSGTIRVFQDGAVRTFATVPTVTTEPGGGYSERGLLGLAISPTFAQDHYVYAFFSNTDHAHQQILRWTDCGGNGTDQTALISFPSGSDCCHKGGRIAFGPDGRLYVTLGDEHTASAAQNTSDVRGKVLRYNPDGSIPSDNPFGPGDPVWAYGFRNPFGIAFSPSGQMAITNNGPSGELPSLPSTGYDTVDLNVTRGSGHQWALCYGYSHVLPPATSCGGQPGPDWSSEASTVVPTGAAFVDGSGPAGYAGHLVFCSYTRGMEIVTPGSPASVSGGPSTCTLDVVQGPDHALYFSDTGHIYRLG